ncbi:SGNH hydrolase [Meredithblackwellia eburnea MCA 4105]
MFGETIVLFGDSLTQFSWQEGGTGAALQDFFQRRFDVLNRGFSGFNSTWGVHFGRQIFTHEEVTKIKLLIVWFGANDCLVPNEALGQANSLDQYLSNLRTIISLVPATVPVILIPPPPFGPRGRAKHFGTMWKPEETKFERTVERCALYARKCVELGEELASSERKGSLSVIKLNDILEKEAVRLGEGDREDGLEQLLCDGVHLGPVGYRVLTQHLLETIKTTFPEINNAPLTFPDYREVDHLAPEKYFVL